MVNFGSDISGTIRLWMSQVIENCTNIPVVYSLDADINYPKIFKKPDVEAMQTLSAGVYMDLVSYISWSDISFKFWNHLDEYYWHVWNIPENIFGEPNEEYMHRISKYISKYTISWRIDTSFDEVINNHGDFIENENRAILLRLEKYLDKWLLDESSVDRYRGVMSVKEMR